MQERLDELTELNDAMQRQMDRFAGLLKTAYHNPNPANMRLLRETSRAMNEQADLLNSRLEALQEENHMKRRQWMMLTLIVVVLMAFVTGFAIAQDEPLATNTPLIVEGTATLVSSEPIPTDAPAATELPVEQPPPDSPPDTTIADIMPYLTVIALGVLLAVVALAGTAIVVAGQGMPKWSRDVLKAGINEGFATLQPIVEATPGEYDDDLLATLHEKINELFARMDALTPNAKAVKPDPLTGEWKDQYPVDKE